MKPFDRFRCEMPAKWAHSPPGWPLPRTEKQPRNRRTREPRYRTHPSDATQVTRMARIFRRTRLAAFTGLTCFFLLSGTFLVAKVRQASVEGIVEDSTGARIAEAGVKLVSSLTGAENRSTTNHDGIFVLPGVFPGPYSIVIEREGFAIAQISGLTLTIGESRNLLIRLKIGSVTEIVLTEASMVLTVIPEASVRTVSVTAPIFSRITKFLLSTIVGVRPE